MNDSDGDGYMIGMLIHSHGSMSNKLPMPGQLHCAGSLFLFSLNSGTLLWRHRREADLQVNPDNLSSQLADWLCNREQFGARKAELHHQIHIISVNSQTGPTLFCNRREGKRCDGPLDGTSKKDFTHQLKCHRAGTVSSVYGGAVACFGSGNTPLREPMSSVCSACSACKRACVTSKIFLLPFFSRASFTIYFILIFFLSKFLLSNY